MNGKPPSARATDPLNGVSCLSDLPMLLPLFSASCTTSSQISWICVLVYLDNILIYSDTLEEHRRHICEVLLQLRNNKLYARGNKCSFHKDTIEYLGFILSPNGLLMDPSKVSTILEWLEPRKIKDIQSFLGFANFYRRFISNYSKITVPLTHLTRKGTPWDFSDAC